MSASTQKKIRQEQRAQGIEKRQVAQQKAEKAAKRSSRIKATVWIVVVAALAAALLASSGFFYNHFTAVKVGDVSYSAAEYNFFYKSYVNNFVNQYGSYLSYLGLDTTKSYDEQQCGISEGKTWAQYFKESVQTEMQETTAMYAEAEKAGFKLTDDDQKTLDSTIDNVKTAYKSSGDYSTSDAYLASIYGKGCTEKMVVDLITKRTIASSYTTEKKKSIDNYTEDQIKSYYDSNKDDLDSYVYLSYFASGKATDTSSSAASSTDTSASPAASASPSPSADELMAEAKTKADGVLAAGKTEDAFKTAAASASGSDVNETTTQGKSLDKSYASWLKDASRKAGDTTVVKSDSGYYALYYISRDTADYYTQNVRHILFKAEASSDGTYTDDAKAAAKAKADAELAKWKAGDKTEDSFAALAKTDSEDTGSKADGGLYKNVYKGQMVSTFENWCYDTSRKAGDTGVIYGESSGSYAGYHVMYYVGQGELYRYKLAEDAKSDADYTTWHDALLKNYTIKEGLMAKFEATK